MGTNDRFRDAALEFATLVSRVSRSDLDGPGLGSWSLRQLIGHTSRALTTVTDFLALPEPDGVSVPTASAYLEVVLRQRGDDEAIALRGRAAGQRLGDDPEAELARMVGAACRAVEAARPGRRIAVGADSGVTMPLDEYLRTRVFELTVHGVDIADAAGLDWTPPSAHLVDALHLAAVNACARGSGLGALRLLTGRRPDAGLGGVLAAGA